ncbi:MAG: cytochrome b/b6 domain-containing protein [Gammaproteobacteria bacterium]
MNEFQRVRVWSLWMRLAHWSIALSVLTLMATGWLVANAPSVAAGASDLHAYAASILMAGLALRIWLLFADMGVGGWEALVPARSSLPAVKQMLMFYCTLGKAPLPNWYGQNPLWVPLYALLYLLLIVMVVTGILMSGTPLLAGFYLPGIHRAFASIIAGMTIAHVIAVVLHDIRGQRGDVSAMLNGTKLFETQNPDFPELPRQAPGVSIDAIGRDRSKKS